MVGWHHQLNGHGLSKLWDRDEDRGVGRTAVHGVTESDVTYQLNNKEASTTNFLFTVLEAQKFKIKALTDLVSGGGPFPGLDCLLTSSNDSKQRGSKLTDDSSEGTNPNHGASTLLTLQSGPSTLLNLTSSERPHLLMLSYVTRVSAYVLGWRERKYLGPNGLHSLCSTPLTPTRYCFWLL